MKTCFGIFVLFAAVSFSLFAADGRSGSRTAPEKEFDKDNPASVRAYAERGNPEAQYYFGLRCEKEKDMTEAVKWYRKAAEQDDLDAQYRLGLCYDRGEGLPRDYREAVKWYRKAAENGIVEAQFNLGICCENGNGTEKNIPEAIEWYRKAADRKYVDAQYRIGFCYENYGEVRDYDKAAIWYRRAAERGNADAQYRIGLFYETGKGVEKNMIEAVSWYSKSARQGFAEAQFQLGQCYEKGEKDIPRDMSAAIRWYTMAAEQGYGDAKFFFKLGSFFENGSNVARNTSAAIKWYTKAAELGSSEAKLRLNRYTEQQRQGESADNPAAGLADKSVGMFDERTTIILPGEVELEMIRVNAGTFEMSAIDGENRSGEIPHTVTLTQSFFIGRTVVTQRQWKAVMGNNPSETIGDDLPVNMVSWNDSMEFCEKINSLGMAPGGWRFALPTETQWEYAARGGNRSKGYKYCGSNDVKEVAWYLGNAGGSIHPVGQKKPNELGLYDMSGNTDEWCLDDWADRSDQQKAEFTRENDQGGYRVIRGGSAHASAYNCRPADRGNNARCPPTERFDGRSFRLVLVPVK